MKITIIMIIAYCLTFVSCNAGLDPLSAQDSNKIAGRYILQKASNKEQDESYIIIKPNHTYQVVNAPSDLTTDTGDPAEIVSGTAKWSFGCDAGYCILELSGLQTGELLFKNGQKMELRLNAGDLDERKEVVYERN